MSERGLALGIVVVWSVVFAIAAFAAMMIAVSRTQTSALQEHRLQAQYAAEAGLVFAMQQLWSNPNYCVTSAPLAMAGMTVSLTVTNCDTRSNQTIQATVTY